MGAKGSSSDWYGDCVDDLVIRADAWKVEKKNGARSLSRSSPRFASRMLPVPTVHRLPSVDQ